MKSSSQQIKMQMAASKSWQFLAHFYNLLNYNLHLFNEQFPLNCSFAGHVSIPFYYAIHNEDKIVTLFN